MLWGSDVSSFKNDQAAWSGVKTVLSFNEPDGVGGGSSNVDPKLAAQLHRQHLNDLSHKIGAPGTRQGGDAWFEVGRNKASESETSTEPAFLFLQSFEKECNALGGCRYEVAPYHW